VNIQEYISSGVVESYVLGLLTAQERFEFEQLCNKHYEIKAAREAFELALEKEAMQNAVPPPPELKQKISDVIFGSKKSAPVMPLKTKQERKITWLQLAAAACFILLAGSVWWILNLRNENQQLQAELKKSNEQIAQLENDARAIQKEGVKMVGLAGTANSPQSFATVYWDTTSHDVYLLVNNLPRPASDEQYQLWAILKSGEQLQPIDLGFLEITQKPLQLYRMNNAQAAHAFAITLEKKDGNPAPNLDKIYVMANL